MHIAVYFRKLSFHGLLSVQCNPSNTTLLHTVSIFCFSAGGISCGLCSIPKSHWCFKLDRYDFTVRGRTLFRTIFLSRKLFVRAFLSSNLFLSCLKLSTEPVITDRCEPCCLVNVLFFLSPSASITIWVVFYLLRPRIFRQNRKAMLLNTSSSLGSSSSNSASPSKFGLILCRPGFSLVNLQKIWFDLKNIEFPEVSWQSFNNWSTPGIGQALGLW